MRTGTLYRTQRVHLFGFLVTMVVGGEDVGLNSGVIRLPPPTLVMRVGATIAYVETSAGGQARQL